MFRLNYIPPELLGCSDVDRSPVIPDTTSQKTEQVNNQNIGSSQRPSNTTESKTPTTGSRTSREDVTIQMHMNEQINNHNLGDGIQANNNGSGVQNVNHGQGGQFNYHYTYAQTEKRTRHVVTGDEDEEDEYEQVNVTLS